ncbi:MULTISPECIES: glycosyltransferase family 2 protein [unclassified Sinorhizobium]|uniref:glycosyltransferase family 2 protein n=1 Tax=unclassified Sinorhizobium TaxID=2613772 RepID=UPI00352523DE
MSDPRLAVIITCWNYKDYVGRAIDSVASQGRDDCELVVIDDGSTDSSWDVIRNSGAAAYQTENGGQRKACLYGLKKTRAPFVMFLDADDELLPGSLATILSKLDHDVAKLQFPLMRIDSDGNVIGDPVPSLRDFRGRQLVDEILRESVYTTPPTSGNVFRRDICYLLEEAHYDRAVDGVILFAAPFMGEVVSLSQPLGLYRVHDSNDSSFGSPLDPQLLKRDLSRFVDRANHLRRILSRRGQAQGLVSPEDTYFYLEHHFYLAIAEGRRISAANLSRLLKRLWIAAYCPLSTKAVITVFLILTALLPNERARAALSYRLEAGNRSTIGLLQALFSPRKCPATP